MSHISNKVAEFVPSGGILTTIILATTLCAILLVISRVFLHPLSKYVIMDLFAIPRFNASISGILGLCLRRSALFT